MPPALQIPRSCLLHNNFLSPFLAPFLLPSSNRFASILASLADNRSAYNKKIRRGRGPSSGKGKTSGRGHKGQKQHGKVPFGFNGGQTPDEVVSGTRGFKNVFAVDMVPINLSRIQLWVDQGRLDPSKPITIKELSDANCVANIKDGVKLLAGGSESLRTPLHIVVSRASTASITAVESAGGSVMTRFYTPFAIQRILRGTTDPVVSLKSQLINASEVEGGERLEGGESATQQSHSGFLHRLPDPTSRKDIEYYRDPAHRGYLSYMVGQGQTPSLFFKAPRTGPPTEITSRKSRGKDTSANENRMW